MSHSPSRMLLSACPQFRFPEDALCTLIHISCLSVFFPSSCLFYTTMPRYKLEPGKLDYHSDSIFRIPPSYGPFGTAEQRRRRPQVGRLCNNWALPTGHALRYSRHATVIDLTQSYFSVSLPTISSIGAQIKGIPWAELCEEGWRVTAGTALIIGDSEKYFLFLNYDPFFLFPSCSHTQQPPSFLPSLPPSPSPLPTATLIPGILLQGLISFPFLERLFKYCYIYSQQQPGLPASLLPQQQQKAHSLSPVSLLQFPVGTAVCSIYTSVFRVQA